MGRLLARLAAIKVVAVLLLVVLLVLLVVGLAANSGGSQAAASATACGPAANFGNGALSSPIPAGQFTVSSPFGPRAGGFHYGLDMAAPDGTPIYAAAAGLVVEAGPASGFGLWIVIDSTIGGQKVSTVYGHMNDGGLLVSVGQQVTAGQQIALVGHNGEATGPHLHFEVWPGGRLTGGTAVDPAGWLSPTGAPIPPAGPVSTSSGVDLAGPVPPQGSQSMMMATPEQLGNVATIVGVTKGKGLPLRAAVLAVAAAEQESGLRNLTSGDRDSVGLFQQRPSQGWGTVAQILDPVYATGKFLDGLAGEAGWAGMALTDAVQGVQRSGFPAAYAKWESDAERLVAADLGVDPITAGVGPAPSPCGG